MQLHDYQIEDINFILKKQRCALWYQMGLGKTITALTAFHKLYKKGEIQNILIIAPLRVAKHTWPNEIKNWKHIDFCYSVVVGTPKQREKALCEPTDVKIVNVDVIPWLCEFYASEWPYDAVIIDEADKFKSCNTKRFKALKKRLKKANYVVELTGTPSANGLLDLWSQIFLLDNGARLEKNITAYKFTYFDSDWLGYNWTAKPNAQQIIENKLKDIVRVRRSKDLIDVPDVLNLTYIVDLPSKAKKIYKDIKKEYVAKIKEKIIEANNAAVAVSKLQQISNGFIYDEGNVIDIHDEKIEALQDIIAKNPNENIIIAYNFKQDAQKIQKTIKDAVLLSDDNIEKWNNKEISILLAHPQSCGHGLNLQSGGNTIVWFSPTWSLRLKSQMDARLYRQGQQNKVKVITIITKDTIDERILEMQSLRHISQQQLLDAITFQ